MLLHAHKNNNYMMTSRVRENPVMQVRTKGWILLERNSNSDGQKQSISPSHGTKRKKRRRSQRSSTPYCSKTSLVKQVPRVVLTGVLSRTYPYTIFHACKSALGKVPEPLDSQTLCNCLLSLLHYQMAYHVEQDLPLLTYIVGVQAVWSITKDVQTVTRTLKDLLKNLRAKFRVRQYGYLVSIVHHYLCFYYMLKNKPGKAWKFQEEAKQWLQHADPNYWTSWVFWREAQLMEWFAIMKPPPRKKHFLEAYFCYKLAREHHLKQECGDNEGFYGVCCMLRMVFAKLEMPIPSPDIVCWFSNTNVLVSHGLACSIGEDDIEEAMGLVKKMNYSGNFKDFYEYGRVLAVICIELRTSQVNLQSGHVNPALNAICQSMKTFEIWNEKYGKTNYSETVVLRTKLPVILRSVLTCVMKQLNVTKMLTGRPLVKCSVGHNALSDLEEKQAGSEEVEPSMLLQDLMNSAADKESNESDTIFG